MKRILFLSLLFILSISFVFAESILNGAITFDVPSVLEKQSSSYLDFKNDILKAIELPGEVVLQLQELNDLTSEPSDKYCRIIISVMKIGENLSNDVYKKTIDNLTPSEIREIEEKTKSSVLTTTNIKKWYPIKFLDFAGCFAQRISYERPSELGNVYVESYSMFAGNCIIYMTFSYRITYKSDFKPAIEEFKKSLEIDLSKISIEAQIAEVEMDENISIEAQIAEVETDEKSLNAWGILLIVLGCGMVVLGTIMNVSAKKLSQKDVTQNHEKQICYGAETVNPDALNKNTTPSEEGTPIVETGETTDVMTPTSDIISSEESTPISETEKAEIMTTSSDNTSADENTQTIRTEEATEEITTDSDTASADKTSPTIETDTNDTSTCEIPTIEAEDLEEIEEIKKLEENLSDTDCTTKDESGPMVETTIVNHHNLVF